MPRKSKGFKSRLRAAAKLSQQGKHAEAGAAWHSISVDREKLKKEKADKRAAKKAARAAKSAKAGG